MTGLFGRVLGCLQVGSWGDPSFGSSCAVGDWDMIHGWRFEVPRAPNWVQVPAEGTRRFLNSSGLEPKAQGHRNAWGRGLLRKRLEEGDVVESSRGCGSRPKGWEMAGGVSSPGSPIPQDAYSPAGQGSRPTCGAFRGRKRPCEVLPQSGSGALARWGGLAGTVPSCRSWSFAGCPTLAAARRTASPGGGSARGAPVAKGLQFLRKAFWSIDRLLGTAVAAISLPSISREM